MFQPPAFPGWNAMHPLLIHFPLMLVLPALQCLHCRPPAAELRVDERFSWLIHVACQGEKLRHEFGVGTL